MYALCYIPKSEGYCIITMKDAVMRSVDFYVNKIGLEHQIVEKSTDKKYLEQKLKQIISN